MAHIGNGHQQTPPLATTYLGGLTIHRIVKVTRVFAVDRDQRHIAQIYPVFAILGQNFVGQALGLVNAAGGKLVRNAVLAHGDFDLHTRIVDFTQHLLDTSNRLPKQSGRLGQFDHHHLTSFSSPRGAFGDHHVLTITLVFRGDQPEASFLQKASNNGLLGAFDNFNHAPFRPTLSVLAHDANLDTVTV